MHACGELDDKWLDMFTKCVEASMFQPEPDAPVRTVAVLSQPHVLGKELNTIPDTTLAAGLHKQELVTDEVLEKEQVENAQASTELLRQMMKSSVQTRSQDLEVTDRGEEVMEAVVEELNDVENKPGEGDEKLEEKVDDVEGDEDFDEAMEEDVDIVDELEKKKNYDIYKRLEFVPVSNIL